MVLQHLRPRAGLVLLSHGLGPNAARYPANDGVFRVNAIGEEKTQIGTELIQLHAAAQVVFYVGEPIGQRERQLRNWIGACFGDVVSANGNAVEVADRSIDEGFLDIPHQSQCKFR